MKNDNTYIRVFRAGLSGSPRARRTAKNVIFCYRHATNDHVLKLCYARLPIAIALAQDDVTFC